MKNRHFATMNKLLMRVSTFHYESNIVCMDQTYKIKQDLFSILLTVESAKPPLAFGTILKQNQFYMTFKLFDVNFDLNYKTYEQT